MFLPKVYNEVSQRLNIACRICMAPKEWFIHEQAGKGK